MKQSFLLFTMLLFLLFASSCSLLPVEEEAPPPPLLRSYEKTEYKLAEASMGDIVETLRISCQYSPALEESLSFGVGGVYVDSVYVSTGDMVSEGDILAELDRTDILSKIDSQTAELKRLNLEKKQLKETYTLDLKTHKLLNSPPATVESITNNYNLRLEIIGKRISTADALLMDLQKQSDQRVLHAGIEGTVTYLKTTDPYTRSKENEKFITISDKTSSLFVASGKGTEHIVVGNTYNIILSNMEHEAAALSPSELGLEDTDNIAYLRLVEPVLDLKERATGTIMITLDSRTDVLNIPSNTVKSANGQTIVYIQDEAGLKTIRNVDVGFVANGKAEVLSGLEKGDLVIVE